MIKQILLTYQIEYSFNHLKQLKQATSNSQIERRAGEADIFFSLSILQWNVNFVFLFREKKHVYKIYITDWNSNRSKYNMRRETKKGENTYYKNYRCIGLQDTKKQAKGKKYKMSIT